MGWTGELSTSRVEQIRAGSGRNLDFRFRAQGSPHFWQYVPDPSGRLWGKQPENAKAAMAEAHALRQSGHLEEARLRYQHALGLMDGIQSDAEEAIQALNSEILAKRAETYPRLNQKLNFVLRNQPLGDAIRTVVNAGGFQLDLVPQSLEDVATLLNLSECRMTYLDLQHATIIQGLEWLLAPYHLTWQMDGAKTITVGTARRMPGTSVWSYDVQDIALILTSKFDEDASAEDIINVLNTFLQAIRTVIDQTDDSGIKSGSAVLINPGLLLVYGTPDVHEKVKRFLEALKDSNSDITSIAAHELSEAARVELKALQKLTTVKWKKFPEAREKAAAAKANQRVIANLEMASLQLLAASINGEIHLEALTRLQMAWASPHLKSLLREEYPHLGMRSAWCIRTAARAVPTDVELTALSESVLSKIRQVKTLKPKDSSYYKAYLGAVYGRLALRNENAPNSEDTIAIKTLLKKIENADLGAMPLVAESLLLPAEKSDKALAAALSAHQIYGDDLLLLTGLIAKRRGGNSGKPARKNSPISRGKVQSADIFWLSSVGLRHHADPFSLRPPQAQTMVKPKNK